MADNEIDKFLFIKPRSQLNTAGTKPLLHGNIHNHATAVFLFPLLSLDDIAFEEFGLFKDMYKLPELCTRQLVIIDTQPFAYFPQSWKKPRPKYFQLFPFNKFSEIQLYFFYGIAYNGACIPAVPLYLP